MKYTGYKITLIYATKGYIFTFITFPSLFENPSSTFLRMKGDENHYKKYRDPLSSREQFFFNGIVLCFIARLVLKMQRNHFCLKRNSHEKAALIFTKYSRGIWEIVVVYYIDL